MVIFIQDDSIQSTATTILSTGSNISVFALTTNLNSLSTNSTLSINNLNTTSTITATGTNISVLALTTNVNNLSTIQYYQ